MRCTAEEMAMDVIQRLPAVRQMLAADVAAIYNGDPAAGNFGEIISCYPAIKALVNYRVAHELLLMGVPLIPRMLTEMAHSETGIDIHPAAQIGQHFAIDHGTGVVVGATCIIGRNVKLYQAGYPEWSKKDYIEIGTAVVKNAFDGNTALLIDARPYAKFLAESIPGAISVNDTDISTLMGRFPNDKSTSIITFCQGYDCKKSHAVAQKLVSMGYTKVANYSAGLPAWKKAGLKKGGNFPRLCLRRQKKRYGRSFRQYG